MRQRLAAEIRAACRRAEGQPMVWGRDDCALWCADIYRHAMGSDPAGLFRGRYDSEQTALAVLGRGGLLRAVIRTANALQWRLVDPGKALPGDLGIARTPSGPACVIRGEALWLGRIDNGFAAHPTTRILHAWSVA